MSTETETKPRIWIGCLRAYNAGKLHGEWVDAAVDDDEIWEAQKRVLRTSPEPRAEEHFIADYEGFGGYLVGEYASLSEVAKIARLIEAKGAAFAAWIGYDEGNAEGDEDEIEERFDEQSRGEWDSEREFAEEQVRELGLPSVGYLYAQAAGSGQYSTGLHYERSGNAWSELLDDLYPYLDWDVITRTILGDYYTVEADGKVYVFSNY